MNDLIPFPFTSAQDVSEGSTGRPALLRTKAGMYFSSRRELARERARRLASGDYTVYEVLLEVWGESVDVSTYHCCLCHGNLPEIGRVLVFKDEYHSLEVIHRGCYRSIDGVADLDAWAFDPTDEGGAA